MGLEVITDLSTPSDLNEFWPLGGDQKSEGDNHLRNLKLVVKKTYEKFNFATLPAGAFISVFDGSFDYAGMQTQRGGIVMDFPTKAHTLYVEEPLTQVPSPLVYTPLGTNSPPQHFKTSALVNSILQPVDTTISNGPIEFPIIGSSNTFATQYTLRWGGIATANVRFSIQELDADGSVIYQSATFDELKQGSGFTIAATGDTVFAPGAMIRAEVGRPYFVTFERYDSVTDSLIKTGINLKGDLVGGIFTPYIERAGYPYVVTALREATEPPAVIETFAIENKVSTLITVDTVLATASTQTFAAGITYRWKVDLLTLHTASNNAYASIKVLINGVPVDDTGSGTVGDVITGTQGRAISRNFRGRFSFVAETTTSVVVQATIGSGTVTSLKATLTLERVN